MTTSTYRALDLLTRGGYQPVVGRRAPYWRPPVPRPARAVHLPSWDWESATVGAAGDRMIDLDVSGAYLAALSSGNFGHGAITHTRTWDQSSPAPGYYHIVTPVWQVPDIVSPLGSARTGDMVWIMHPTLKLLMELGEAGYIAYPDVHDSWTADSTCRLRKWAEKMRNDRAAVMATRAAAAPDSVARAAADKAYTDLKSSYSMAVQMMLGTDVDGQQQATKSPLLRPDWYATVHAQHAATMWRKVWRTCLAGHLPFSMGSTDEVCYPQTTWNHILTMNPAAFRIDPSGVQIGSLKVKDIWTLA